MPPLSETYPRVLVISGGGLSTNSATGMTMANLFKGWPLDCIAQIYLDDFGPDRDVCINSRTFSNRDVPLVNRLKNIVSAVRISRSAVTSEGVSIAMVDGSLTHSVAAVWADITPFRLSDDLWRWIKEFSPQVIYSVLGSNRIMRICLMISEKCLIPIVPHFMDDWPMTIYRETLLHVIPRRILLATLRNILHRAPLGMTISDAMAQEYAIRYGMRFVPFMNCVEVPSRQVSPAREEGGTIEFGYIGGLHLNRWNSLRQIGDALMQLNKGGPPAKLIIFAPEKDIRRYGPLLREHPMIHIGGSLPSVKSFGCPDQFRRFGSHRIVQHERPSVYAPIHIDKDSTVHGIGETHFSLWPW